MRLVNDAARGLGLALRPISDRCIADGGRLVEGRLKRFEFKEVKDRRQPVSSAMPGRVVCSVDDRLAWGADIEITDGTYFVPLSGGELLYESVVVTRFIDASALADEAKREAEGRERIATYLQEQRRAEDARAKECTALRDEYSKRVRSNPRVGMRVQFGMIIEVKQPLALVQYDSAAVPIKGREQEWIAVSLLGPGEDCPR